MLVKLTPVVNFINILRTNISYECSFGSFFYVYVTREKLPKPHFCKQFVRNMLMKLTLECRPLAIVNQFHEIIFLIISLLDTLEQQN